MRISVAHTGEICYIVFNTTKEDLGESCQRHDQAREN